MPLNAGTRIGSYELISLLGKGGMGEVYRARDLKLKREVAIKVLPASMTGDRERMQRFQREAEVLASLNHPNIAQIYGLEDDGDMRAIVMELVEGDTLADIAKRGPIPVDRSIDYAKQILSAFEYAHDRPRPVIHRDLKPANVKVTPDGMIKVLDFGLAKALTEERHKGDDPENSPTLTLGPSVAGAIIGTAAYMSPEQAKGKEADRRSDIWSFGVLLYEMATAQRMFTGDEVADVLVAVIRDEPDLSKLPVRLRRAVERCIRKEPRKRWYSMEDIRFALDETEEEPEASAISPVKSRSPRLAWAVAVALAIGLGVPTAMHFREKPPEAQLLQYEIPVPDKSVIRQLSLSPDGRYVVFALTGSRNQLFIRALDSPQAQPLPGTEDAAYPFWSPDSRYIAFFADDKLKRMPVTGGPAQTLCDAPNPRGGTWGKSGTIIFAPLNGDTGLFRVPAAGGVAVNVTKPEGGNHRQPFFLPDGLRLLYAAFAGKEPGVYVRALDEKGDVAKGSPGTPRRLSPDLSAPRFVASTAANPNAYLLFVRDQTLMAQPVNPTSLEGLGDIFPVAEHVARGVNNGNFLYSTSETGMLTYATGNGSAGAGTTRQLAWFDRSGKFLSNVGMPVTSTEVALSPDGKRIVQPKSLATGSDLWVFDEQGIESRFTFADGASRSAAWSPDGKLIAFASSRGGTSGDIYQKASNNTGQDELLYKSPVAKTPWGWSPDGRFIVFTSQDTNNQDDLLALPAKPGNGTERMPIPLVQSRFQDYMGQVSPDGRWLAYVSTESNRPQVYVIPFSPGKPVTGKWQVSTGGGSQPRWRADGKELYYTSPERMLMAVEVKASESTFDRATPQPLFELRFNPADNRTQYRYAPAPDGKRFLEQTDPGATVGAEVTPVTLVTNWLAAVKR